jgi:predicted transcriptional regulator
MSEQNKFKTVRVRLPASTKAALDRFAANRGESESVVIREAIRRLLEKEQKRQAKETAKINA